MAGRAATENLVQVHHLPIRIEGDPQRVMMRFFWPGAERAQTLIGQLADLEEREVHRQVQAILGRFSDRHPDLQDLLMSSAQQAASIS